MKLLPEFTGADGSQQELTGDDQRRQDKVQTGDIWKWC